LTGIYLSNDDAGIFSELRNLQVRSLSKAFQILYGYSKAFLLDANYLQLGHFQRYSPGPWLNPAKDRIPIDNKL